MMKKLIPLVILLLSFNAMAQRENNEQRQARLKALKISYVTETINLTPQEAEKFWPLYNAYEKELQDIRNEFRATFRNNRNENRENLSEPLASNLIDMHIKAEETKAILLKNLVSDLQPVLSSKKIWQLIRSEDGFRRKLLEQYRNRRREGNKRNKP